MMCREGILSVQFENCTYNRPLFQVLRSKMLQKKTTICTSSIRSLSSDSLLCKKNPTQCTFKSILEEINKIDTCFHRKPHLRWCQSLVRQLNGTKTDEGALKSKMFSRIYRRYYLAFTHTHTHVISVLFNSKVKCRSRED